MIKQGRLDKPYTGVLDCTRRAVAGASVLAGFIAYIAFRTGQ